MAVVHRLDRVVSTSDSCRVVQPTPDAQKPVGRTTHAFKIGSVKSSTHSLALIFGRYNTNLSLLRWPTLQELRYDAVQCGS